MSSYHLKILIPLNHSACLRPLICTAVVLDRHTTHLIVMISKISKAAMQDSRLECGPVVWLPHRHERNEVFV